MEKDEGASARDVRSFEACSKERTSMAQKVLITLRENNVAPRFDLTTEVLIAWFGKRDVIEKQKIIVLPHASPEELCHLILSEEVTILVCSAIEEEYYQYLTWKKVRVLDGIIGPYERALDRLRRGRLQSGDILFDRSTKDEACLAS